jgi:MFS family permease
LILPFEIIYLHQFRGFSTATAGFVLAATLGTGTLVTLPSGALLDRFRAKPILIAAVLASALGYAGLAFVDRPWQAFACAVIGGAGVGVTRTAYQTLLITLITPEQRVASFALGRAAQNLGLGLGAAVAGFVLSSAQDLQSYQALYLFDAITYVALALVVLAVVPNRRAAAADHGTGREGFRAVARDRRFLIVIGANLLLIIVGYALFANILPPFVKAHTHVGTGAIGILFIFNTFFVAIAQLPATRLFTRMHRARTFATASGLFAIALLGVLPATLINSELGATALLCGRRNADRDRRVRPLRRPRPTRRRPRSPASFRPLHLGPQPDGDRGLRDRPGRRWRSARVLTQRRLVGGAVVAGAVGGGFLLAGDRIPNKPLAATESKAPPDDPMPEAA